jgi:predicted metal-dependent peptidase
MATALLRMVPRWSNIVPTLAVDRAWRLYLNPQFVEENPPAQLALLLVGHELQHALGDHADRLSEYRHDLLLIGGEPVSLANVAHDLAINSNLQSFVTSATNYRNSISRPPIPMECPTKALYPSRFKDGRGKPYPDGLVSEAYAELLKKLPKVKSPFPPGKGKGDDSGQPGNPSNGSGPGDGKMMEGPGDAGQPSPGTNAGCGKCGSAAGDGKNPWEDPAGADARNPDSGVTKIEQEMIGRHVAQAARDQEIKARGTVPGGVQMWANAVLTPPKVDWRKELRRAVKSGMNWIAGLMDYTYTRPNRRSHGRIILPGFQKPLPRFCCILDTSGSMSLNDYNAAFSEVASVIRVSGHKRVPMLACDAAVSEIQMVSSITEFKMTGGGGTDMGIGIRAAVEDHNMRLVFVFTDGVSPWIDRIDGVRVVACLTRPRNDSYPIPEWIHVVEAFDK